jgi:hypothetical protein
MEPTVGEASEASKHEGALSELDHFFQLDEVNVWSSRTRDLESQR